jgi:RecQ family ATP-dependent DNA helicase
LCGTERPSNADAVIDLTVVCSSNTTTQSNNNDNDTMESYRSRRCRSLVCTVKNGKRQNEGSDETSRSKNDAIEVDLVDKTSADVEQSHRNCTKSPALANSAVQFLTHGSKRERPNEPVTFQHDNGNRKRLTYTPVEDQQNQRHVNSIENNRPATNNDDEGKKKIKDTSKRSRLADIFNQRTNHPSTALVENLMERATHILQSTFKLTSLRPLQQKAIHGSLSGISQIVIMATGGGKSLCYQLPAVLVGAGNHQVLTAKNSRVTIVVCPLIALMIDQVNNLMKKGIRTAACWSSSHSAKDKAEIMKRLSINEKESAKKSNKSETVEKNVDLTPIQILYVTPELIETERFRDILKKLYCSNRLFMFAIDEAHCLSTWGHDFRPAYRKLTWIVEAFQNVPVMACTGTATERVISDIRSTLCFGENVPCHLGTFNRQNIKYEVRFKDSLNVEHQGAINDLVNEVKMQHFTAEKAKQPCAGIVYVHKREDCQSLATQIFKTTGILAAAYHAGLKDAEREETQRKWCDGTIKVAVATVAFGMGIDLPHVRYVIHWTMSKSIEGFYQESGRAGRDGLPSASILYYSKDDASKFTFLVKQNAEKTAQKNGQLDRTAAQKLDHALLEIKGMVDYCLKPGCKRQYLLFHFGEKIDPNHLCKKTCDYCLNPAKVEMSIQASECASAVIMSQKSWHTQRNANSETKYPSNPTASDESLADQDQESDDEFGMDQNDGLLGITSYAGYDEMIQEPLAKKGRFVKASIVLKKYETLECQKGKKGGVINFKTRSVEDPSDDDRVAKRSTQVSIPIHLRGCLPDPFAGSYKKEAQSSEKKSSSFYASEAERLRQELEEIRRKKQRALEKLGRM